MNRWALIFILLWASLLAITTAHVLLNNREKAAEIGGYAMASIFAAGLFWKNKP